MHTWARILGLYLVAGTTYAEPHGPSAPGDKVPSHHFDRRAHTSDAQLSFHYGLAQPILLRGFNAAVDLRVGRFIVSYSHGQGLDFSRPPGALSAEEAAAGLRVIAPYSTGGGVGMTLFDEVYVLADLKIHHFEASAGAEVKGYSTVTIGAEAGWRFFVWRGLHVTPVVRYWPTVWDNAPESGVMVETSRGDTVQHGPMAQGYHGLFANVLVGWAFNL